MEFFRTQKYKKKKTQTPTSLLLCNFVTIKIEQKPLIF